MMSSINDRGKKGFFLSFCLSKMIGEGSRSSSGAVGVLPSINCCMNQLTLEAQHLLLQSTITVVTDKFKLVVVVSVQIQRHLDPSGIFVRLTGQHMAMEPFWLVCSASRRNYQITWIV